jgi:hypothetical protein
MEHPRSSDILFTSHFTLGQYLEDLDGHNVRMLYTNTLEGTARNLLGDVPTRLRQYKKSVDACQILCKWMELTYILLILDQSPWICPRILSCSL